MLNTANEFATIPTGAPPGWRAFDIGVSSRNLINQPVRTFAVTEVLRLLSVGVAFIAILSALSALALERSRELVAEVIHERGLDKPDVLRPVMGAWGGPRPDGPMLRDAVRSTGSGCTRTRRSRAGWVGSARGRAGSSR